MINISMDRILEILQLRLIHRQRSLYFFTTLIPFLEMFLFQVRRSRCESNVWWYLYDLFLPSPTVCISSSKL